ncbi:MAG TPA: transcriptional regulator [Candidatus Thermoplasmatota archaeon]|nr:transcriptional regulator [Candidatus Thermoplasmatota archaeon]
MAAGLDPLLSQPTRLQILAYLYRQRLAASKSICADLGLTPGNLASHVARLEEAGYVEPLRALVAVSFEARVRVTPAGDAAFRAHVAALRRLLDDALAP